MNNNLSNEEYEKRNYTTTIGNIGESVAKLEFIKRNIPVFDPLYKDAPYDMIILLNGQYLKIQTKTISSTSKKYTIMDFSITKQNYYSHEHILYTKEEVDYFFLYCIENNYMGLISIEDTCGKCHLYIRIIPPLNTNSNINYACDYQLDYSLLKISYNNLDIPIRSIDNYLFNYGSTYNFIFNPYLDNILSKNKNSKNNFDNYIKNKYNKQTVSLECPIKFYNNINITREKLKELIRNYPFLYIGHLYNVSDNTIRKWCLNLGLPFKKQDINNYTDEEWKYV